MLETDEFGEVSGFLKAVAEVELWVIEAEPAVGEAEHAALVAGEAGEHGGATGGATGGGAEGLAEEGASLGKFLEVGGDHGGAVDSEVATGVVGVKEDNIGLHRCSLTDTD